jgi:hypothetical protein
MHSSFQLINDLTNFLQPLYAPWFVSGGWAIDLHLNHRTRERGDLDISVPAADRYKCIEFFLAKDWQIEGKLFGSFKAIHKLADYDEDIHYFWSFPKGADFIQAYEEESGNRRIAYNRKTQHELDYIEVFFDRIDDKYYCYRRNPQVRRPINQAILERDGVRYLAPELVLLYKSNQLSEKNTHDFNAVVGAFGAETNSWLTSALTLLYGNSHIWLKQLRE